MRRYLLVAMGCGVLTLSCSRADNRSATNPSSARLVEEAPKAAPSEDLAVAAQAQPAQPPMLEAVAASPLAPAERAAAAAGPAPAAPKPSLASPRGDSKATAARAPGARSAKPQSPLSVHSEAKVALAREPQAAPDMNTESYSHVTDNAFLSPRSAPLSTFSIDVDTASYANVRRSLNQGQLPPPDAVRIEELVNYFTYAYPQPKGDSPFSVTTELSRAPWEPSHELLLVGLQGKKIVSGTMPSRNLVFLIDVSGSMNEPNKLPLLKQSLIQLVDTLNERDRVSLVVYAGASGLVLPPTPASDKQRLRDAIGRLEAGGSTAGAAGIELAYQMAEKSFDPKGTNRVILATDGDFNVGPSSEGELIRIIEKKRELGVFLTVLGFGMGNYKDSQLEKLADHGNGNYAYIDSAREARKVLVEQGGGTLVTIAKDVKIQIEFNPERVAAYRLIGYENRILQARDFNDDRKDAGEIGAGHSVTALYEIVPPGAEKRPSGVDPLKYQSVTASDSAKGKELATVKLRFKHPSASTSELAVYTVADQPTAIETASANLRFASAVAGFGMMLRKSEHRGRASYALLGKLASGAMDNDAGGHRNEFLTLLGRASELDHTVTQLALPSR